MDNGWYLKIGRQVVGPVTREELIGMIRSGQVGPATLAMAEDGTGFAAIRELPPFSALFREPPPPSPVREPPAPVRPPASFRPPSAAPSGEEPPPSAPPPPPRYTAADEPDDDGEPYITVKDKKRPDPLIIALMVVVGLLILTISAGVIWYVLSGSKIPGLGKDTAPTASAASLSTRTGTAPSTAPSAAPSASAAANPSASAAPVSICVFDRAQYDLTRCYEGGTLDQSDDALFVVGTDSSSIYRLDTAATARTLIVMAPAPIGSLNVSGDYLFYLSNRDLYRVPLHGGAPESLPEAGTMDSLLILEDRALIVDGGRVYVLDEALQRTEIPVTGAKSGGVLFSDGTYLYYYAQAGRRVDRLNIANGETGALLDGVDIVMAAVPEGIYAYDNDRKTLTLYDYQGNAVKTPVDSGISYTGCAVTDGGLYLFSGELGSADGIDYYAADGSVGSVFLPPAGRCRLLCQSRRWAYFEVQPEGGGASSRYLLNLETGAVIPFT